MTLNHVVAHAPVHRGVPRRGGQASDPRPVLALGASLFRPKRELGPPGPSCSWLHLRTPHLIPGVGQTGQPQLGDELGGGVELWDW